MIRDGDFTIENVAFEGARAPARNGAGIRFERGRLTVRRCRFTDNENGILTGNIADSELTIEDSEFARAPHDRGTRKHLLYVGRIGALHAHRQPFSPRLRRPSREKSRARESHVAYNLLYDGAGGQAAYELEFPDGGLAVVIGNIIGQSSDDDEPGRRRLTAPKARVWPRQRALPRHTTRCSAIAGRCVVPARWSPSSFPPASTSSPSNNLTVGVGLFTLASPGQFEGNFPVLAGALGDPDTLDFRLGAHSLLRGLRRRAAGDRRSVARADGGVHVAGRHDAARRSRCVDAGRVPIAGSAAVSAHARAAGSSVTPATARTAPSPAAAAPARRAGARRRSGTRPRRARPAC